MNYKNSNDPKEYLSDIEKEKVEQFYKDEVMREAVRKVLLEGVYLNGTLKADMEADPLKNWALVAANNFQDNEQLGAKIRGTSEGVQFIEYGFNNLKTIRKEEVKKSEKEENPAE